MRKVTALIETNNHSFQPIGDIDEALQPFQNILNTIYKRVMLTSVLRALVKNPVKESFYWKRKKKQLMF